MRRRLFAVLGAVLLTMPLAETATAAPDTGTTGTRVLAAHDDRPGAAEQKRRQLRSAALAKVLNGQAKAEKRGASTVVELGKKPKRLGARGPGSGRLDQYVELGREKTDKIFVVLAEFGDQRLPDYPDQDTDPETEGPKRFDGPRHNEIPEPDRAVDNTTIWQRDYSRQHFQDLYFSRDPGANSVANYYDRQSSGRYSVDGKVTDWVRVKYNEARYGRSNGFPCADNTCNNSMELIKDAVNQWVADQRASGKSTEQIRAELAEFDQWDRNDYDGDGDFNEPDGYIDHFQIVHAGGDQANADPIQGEDAIWSHRAYAFMNYQSGPVRNPRGGAQIGDTGLWVGDYTMQPENGGVSVFAHEYGHDLGLPDEYDSAGGTNNVNWWTLMAQNRVNGKGEPIGYRPNDLGAWDKLQLGWLDYEVVPPGVSRTLELGPHEYNSAKAQGLVVPLPKIQKTFDYGPPANGAKMWWSGSADNLDNSMARELDLTGTKQAKLDMKVRYEIEEGFDFAYVEASTDGTHWTQLNGTVNGKPFGRDSGNAPAITGTTGKQWLDASVPLDRFAGKKIQLRFAFRSDHGGNLGGLFADDIGINADGRPVFTDGAENGANGWTLDGFADVTQRVTKAFDNFYIASNRTYESYDRYMRTGPYFRSNPANRNWVEHFPYQTGLLVSYWNDAFTDNNTGSHPGEGQILPVDAHPKPIYDLDGKPWPTTVSGYDVPFSRNKADSFTLHPNGRASYIRGQNGNPVFDDTASYFSPEQPNAGVKLPAVGVGIRVLEQRGTSMKVRVSGTK
ncbi:immune inhibitor A domain-containing protein [Sciscionella sediminilitoris]|uniref:immune inhibitor A domain-containing protein n=1 Tax=Sciscionella sediminilitoris TaxID=1445613 RepID=UPI0004DF02DE|nr:immune inhibitor A domain-containing protein [Sciscionella sp. SE31]